MGFSNLLKEKERTSWIQARLEKEATLKDTNKEYWQNLKKNENQDDKGVKPIDANMNKALSTYFDALAGILCDLVDINQQEHDKKEAKLSSENNFFSDEGNDDLSSNEEYTNDKENKQDESKNIEVKNAIKNKFQKIKDKLNAVNPVKSEGAPANWGTPQHYKEEGEKVFYDILDKDIKGTYAMGVFIGFSKEVSEVVAKACDDIDSLKLSDGTASTDIRRSIGFITGTSFVLLNTIWRAICSFFGYDYFNGQSWHFNTNDKFGDYGGTNDSRIILAARYYNTAVKIGMDALKKYRDDVNNQTKTWSDIISDAIKAVGEKKDISLADLIEKLKKEAENLDRDENKLNKNNLLRMKWALQKLEESLKTLGSGLHPFQDITAHSNGFIKRIFGWLDIFGWARSLGLYDCGISKIFSPHLSLYHNFWPESANHADSITFIDDGKTSPISNIEHESKNGESQRFSNFKTLTYLAMQDYYNDIGYDKIDKNKEAIIKARKEEMEKAEPKGKSLFTSGKTIWEDFERARGNAKTYESKQDADKHCKATIWTGLA